MDTTFYPNKFKYLSDPPVSTQPFSLITDEEKCSGCGSCVKQCPCQSIELVDRKPVFTGLPYFGKICIACHSCEAICPTGALKFSHFYRVDEGRWAYVFDYPEEPGAGLPNPMNLDQPVPLEEIRQELTDVENVIYRRRSVRVYKKKPVSRELIHRVLEAGRFAPSAGNCQGWKFVVVTNQKLLNDLSESTAKFLSTFTKIYQGRGFAKKALKNTLAFVKPNAMDQRPMVAIQALLTPKFGKRPANIFFDAPCVIFLVKHRLHISDPELDMGICSQNMVLTAHALGLGTCYNGFVATALNMDKKTKKNFKDQLGLKWPYDVVTTSFAMGYPAFPMNKPVEREMPKVNWVE